MLTASFLMGRLKNPTIHSRSLVAEEGSSEFDLARAQLAPAVVEQATTRVVSPGANSDPPSLTRRSPLSGMAL